MVGDVFGDERGDVEVAVIVSLALLEDGLDVIVAICGSQQVLRQQLLAGQEVVCCTLVDEELLRSALVLRHQMRGIPQGPVIRIGAQIAGKGLLAPRALGGIGNRRKGGHRLVQPGILKRADQGSVAAHTVAEYTAFTGNHGQIGIDHIHQLLGDIAVHLVVLRPRLLLCIHIESSPASKVVCIILAGNFHAPGRSVRIDDDQVVASGVLLESALLDEVLMRAGQSAEEEQHRTRFTLQSGRRQEDAKGHVALQGV